MEVEDAAFEVLMFRCIELRIKIVRDPLYELADVVSSAYVVWLAGQHSLQVVCVVLDKFAELTFQAVL